MIFINKSSEPVRQMYVTITVSVLMTHLFDPPKAWRLTAMPPELEVVDIVWDLDSESLYIIFGSDTFLKVPPGGQIPHWEIAFIREGGQSADQTED